MNNTLQTQQKKPFSLYITGDAMKGRINQMIGSDKGQSFITAMISAVSNNPALGDCEPSTIISAGLVGESLGLSPSSFMGQYYIVPFKDKKNNRIVAQFQVGYKGYIAMAMKSGTIKDIDCFTIKKGELKGRDKDGKYLFEFIENEEIRENTETIGYMAYVEMINGFKKTIYWSKEKMQKHAEEYSQGYRSDIKNGTTYTFWSKNFEQMAYKTMLRTLISKWCILSTTLEKAVVNDMAVIKEDGSCDYVDNVSNEDFIVNNETGELLQEQFQEDNTEELKKKAQDNIKKASSQNKEKVSQDRPQEHQIDTMSDEDFRKIFGDQLAN